MNKNWSTEVTEEDFGATLVWHKCSEYGTSQFENRKESKRMSWAHLVAFGQTSNLELYHNPIKGFSTHNLS